MHRFLAGLLALSLSSAALAGDPFDDARWHIGAKNTADVLAIVDSGRFDINMQTEEGFTLLHYAAEMGDVQMIRALIERGADPRITTFDGYSIYQMAVGTTAKAEIRKAITAANARDAAGPVADVAVPASAAALAAAGQAVAATQPAAAVSNGMCEMARNDPASAWRSAEMRPFLAAKDAVWYNHPDELAGLIEDCVGVDQTDEYGWTLLHHAADRDRVALAQILLAHGATVGPRNKDGQTAAQLATSAEMKALLGNDTSPARPATEADARRVECRQKYEADAALASDTTGRLSAMRRWQQCLDTGRYW